MVSKGQSQNDNQQAPNSNKENIEVINKEEMQQCSELNLTSDSMQEVLSPPYQDSR